MNANESKQQREIFVREYLSDRAMREAREGKLPAFGYPRNHLPEPTKESLALTTCFLAKPKR